MTTTVNEKRVAEEILNSKTFKKKGYAPFTQIVAQKGELQKIHTPYSLCESILKKLSQYVRLSSGDICVLFNLEFVEVLTKIFKIDPSRITFISDSKHKEEAAKHWYNIKNIHSITYKTKEIKIMPKLKKQFDAVIMNPPYQANVKKNEGGSGSGSTLWDKFVRLSISELLSNDGFLAAVHPPKWRKPGYDLFDIIRRQNVHYLEMHKEADGIKTFGASTSYDWYILQKSAPNGKVLIQDIEGKRANINITAMPFLPNCEFKLLKNMMTDSEKDACPILYSYSAHEPRKPWMSEKKTKKFKYSCVHSTPQTGVRYMFSSKKGGFFGIPKVIFGESRTIQNVVVDMEGEFGITHGAIGIKIKSKQEGEQIKKAIESKMFNELLQRSCRWSQFRIDWQTFVHFRRDFWKDFV